MLQTVLFSLDSAFVLSTLHEEKVNTVPFRALSQNQFSSISRSFNSYTRVIEGRTKILATVQNTNVVRVYDKEAEPKTSFL